MTVEPHVAMFLHLGFIPRFGRSRQYFRHVEEAVARSEDVGSPSDDRAGVARALCEATEPRRSGPHVVPLSSGLDSRLILALLRRHLGPAEVVAVTFGSTGTWDYDLSGRVARDLGVEHVRLDLAKSEFHVEDLESVVRAGADWTMPLGALAMQLLRREVGERARIWSGYLGDVVSGRHLTSEPVWDWEAGHVKFFEKYVTNGAPRAQPDATYLSYVPIGAEQGLRGLEPFDQLHLLVRQPATVRPGVVPARGPFEAPFEHPSVLGAYLGLPRRERVGQAMHRRILEKIAPTVAVLPGSATQGLPAAATAFRRRATGRFRKLVEVGRSVFPRAPLPAHPSTNFLDLDGAFRRRHDFIELAGVCLDALVNRGIDVGLDVEDLHRRHLGFKVNVGELLLRLCALELSLGAVPDPQVDAGATIPGWNEPEPWWR